MIIKTFPLKLTEEFHNKLKEAAYISRESIHEYILKAIEERIEKENNNERL